ncbi:ATP-binding cassette domain-containing protein [Streptomyces sp. NPDC018321]|uniref:ATP-binding cassette domain-containing protein n=1 Tax=unclassified Streptomyces TaxID=2593676 RepID=UPI0037959329
MTGPDEPAALHATDLGFRYRARGDWALRDCGFTVPRGRITALVGRNGAGKSTLLHLAGGLLRPAHGEIRALGAAPDSAPARTRVALLTQDKPLYPRFTVADTLRMGGKLNAVWDRTVAERVVGEGGIPLTARVGELSPGRRTRVALALALGKRPELLLLDGAGAGREPGPVVRLPPGLITASGRREDVLNCPYPSGRELKECMTQHGYVARFYEANPAGDYWAFQWTDTALLGGLALALALVTVLLLRRRI